MLFSSLVFLYIFLPLTLLGYYLIPGRFKNTFLFFASIVFFAWGGVSYSSLLIVSITLNYVFGRLIGSSSKSQLFLFFGVFVNLLFLFVFKYANFVIDNVNLVFTWINMPAVNNPNILLPIGISFYTFQAISYLIDVYRKTCQVQKSYISLGLYIALFPQLIAGPIVRYYDIQSQIGSRRHSAKMMGLGIQRFALGLAKKVLIANPMAFVADKVFAFEGDAISSPLAWIGILAYALQIYYDFAGYSDMAIGLARMFGFELLENFNFPYVAKSIKDFWRRWHISLSNWFRDYLYIALGGNRLGKNRTIANLLIVFFVTGFWHGASWNFLVWGLLHGLFLVLERSKLGSLLEKMPTLIQSLYTLFIVLMAWVMFRAETLEYGIVYYKALFGLNNASSDPFVFYQILNRESIFIFLVGVLGAFGVLQNLSNSLVSFTASIASPKVLLIIKNSIIALFVVFVLFYSTGSLVVGAYNPFIYFRF